MVTVIVPLLQAEDSYRRDLQEVRRKAEKNKSTKNVLTKLYHGELQFSRLGDDAYDAVISLLDAFNDGVVAGYDGGHRDIGAKRYAYQEVGGFPEEFLEEHLSKATSGDEDIRKAWLKQARTLVGSFACRDQSAWFQKFRSLKAAHASFHSYRAWLDLLSYIVEASGKKVVDWEMRLGSILNFTRGNGYRESDPLVLLAPE